MRFGLFVPQGWRHDLVGIDPKDQWSTMKGLVQHADVLLLDEPAAGLDAESRDRTRTVLTEEAARGAAVACVTHDDVSIDHADRVLRLVEGRNVAWTRTH